jgi:hypothetical protein
MRRLIWLLGMGRRRLKDGMFDYRRKFISGIEEAKKITYRFLGGGSKWKDMFIKYDLSRNDDFVSLKIHASKSSMVVRINEKETSCGSRCKFVGASIRQIWIAKASKNSNMRIGRGLSI